MEKVSLTIDHSNRPANYSMNIVNRDLNPTRVTVAPDHISAEGKIKLGYTKPKEAGKSPFPFIVLQSEAGSVKLFGQNAEEITEDPIEWHKDDDGNLVSAISVVDGKMDYHADLLQPVAV